MCTDIESSLITAKTSRHEARASLLGGQPSDRAYQPYAGAFHHHNAFPGPAGGVQVKRAMYTPNSKWSWAFIGIASLQAAIVLALEAYVPQRI